MFIPLGAEGERKLVPWVTLGIILLNLAVHVATLGWVDSADRRRIAAIRHLAEVEYRIEEDRDVRGFDLDALLHEEPGHHSRFWERWHHGEILPRNDPDFIEHEAAVAELKSSIADHPHQWLGFRGARPTLVSLIAAAFLHGGWGHLIGNMVLLWAVGATLEESWGRRLFILCYLVGIFVAPWGSVFGADRGMVPGIGASGAVATVMGAFTVRHFGRKLRIFSVLPMPGVYSIHGGWLLLAWFAQQIYAHGNDTGSGGVGFGVHAFGFLAGVGIALAFRAGGSEAVAQPQQEALVRKTAHAAAVAKADEHLARSDSAGALEELRKAAEAVPDDAVVRERLYTLLAMKGDHAAAAIEARTALRMLWLQGERGRYVNLFRMAEKTLSTTFPADATHKAAVVLEQSDPAEASRLHARVIERSPADPVAKQSLERLAKLFERMGEPDKAAQVRSLRPKLEARDARQAPPPA